MGAPDGFSLEMIKAVAQEHRLVQDLSGKLVIVKNKDAAHAASRDRIRMFL